MSNIAEQIDKAVGAHGLWKTKLRQNIAGTLSLNPADVSVDNRCEFGKWLYGLSGSSAASDPHYKEVLDLHKAFHKAAAEVVTKVQVGDKAGAEASVGLHGEYTAASSRLTAKMVEWKRKAAKAA
ncbi:MAG: CZB domain-containing protein [Nitrospira sp.]|nr:CZB domain-containing protein [Nitrospira sp.]